MYNIAADANDTALTFEIPSNVQDTCDAIFSSKAGVDRLLSMRVKVTMHVLARLCTECEKNVSKKFDGGVSETFVDVETLVFQLKDLRITLWMECMDGGDDANDISNSVSRPAAAKVIREHSTTMYLDMPAQKTTSNTSVNDIFFHPTCFCATHVLSSVFPQAADEDVGTATSGDRAEFFSVTNQSDNTSGLKLESISPDRQRHHHFLADLKAALPNTQASPTLLKLFMLEAETLLHKMFTPGGGLHADARLSLTFMKNDGTLFADQVVQSMRLNFFGTVVCVRKTGLHLFNYREGSCSSTVRLNSSQ